MKPIVCTLLVAALQIGCNEPENGDAINETTPEEIGRRQARGILAKIDAKNDLIRAAMAYESAVSREALALRQRSEQAYALGQAQTPGRAELLAIQLQDKRSEVEELQVQTEAAGARLKSLIKKARFSPEREDAAQVLADASDRISLAKILANGSIPAPQESWQRVESGRFDEIYARWRARSAAASAARD